MTTDIQYINMRTSESLNNFISKKLDKLKHKYNWVISAKVFFKLENDSGKKDKCCEITLSIPGPNVFAQTKEDSFEKAFVATLNSLHIQMKKRKAIFQTT